MADPFIGEIRIFAGNFAPRGWALCNGQTLGIAQNTALFSILGTYYGGDGKSTFGLPDFRGRAPMHQGQGPGLSQQFLGERSGSPTVTLAQGELAQHNHSLNAVPGQRGGGGTSATTDAPAGNSFAAPATFLYVNPAQSTTVMSPMATGLTGSSQPHNNMQPYLAMTFIIALMGVFPPRS